MLKRFLQDKRTRNKCHIYQMLAKHARKPHLSFHTPGHKVGAWDLTELSFSDNLASPRGCIAAAEQDLANLLHAHSAFLLTDGSTSGVFSILFAAKSTGVKSVAIPAVCHPSVENACAIFGLQVHRFSSVERIPAALEHADALFLTSPNYYGKIPPLKALRALCDKEKKLLLIDGAHGGHLHYNQALYAGTYADLWVDGVHKSLPALTQGAVVCAKTERLGIALKYAVKRFRTTSPSYPIMASVEYAVKYPENKDLENAIRAYAEKQPRVVVKEDYTKLCAKFGDNAFKAEKELEKRGIYAEFCDGENIVFYLSPATKKSAFRRLKRTLKKLFVLYEEKTTQRIPAPVVSQNEGETEQVDLRDAEGRICAEDCGLFPPCTPLVRKGERIEKESIYLLENAANTYGLTDGKIRVFKKENEDNL